MEVLFHKACSVSLAAGPQESALLPSCLTKNLPSITTEAPHTGTPSPPTLARSKPRSGMPRWGQAGVTRTAVPRGGAREGTTGPGLWHLGCGCWARALFGEALAGWIQATSEAALVGEAVAAWRRGEPPGLAQPCPGQPTLGSGPSALAFWAVWPQP